MLELCCMLKKVSVIIPLYNQYEFLEEALQSVENSTYSNVEIIVVNDGSNDVSQETIKKCISKFNNIKLINQNNMGVCTARNSGIKEASGDYILPLDADDKIAPTYIEQAVKILDANENIGVVYCEAEYFGAKSGKLNLKPATIKNMLIQNRIFPSALFRKEDYYKTSGYRKELEIGCGDWDLWLQLIELGCKTHKIPQPLFFYRKSDNIATQIALNFSNYVKIRKYIIKFHNKLYKQYWYKVTIPIIILILKNAVFNICNLLKKK